MASAEFRFKAADANGSPLTNPQSWTATATPATGAAISTVLDQYSSCEFSLTDTGSPWTVSVSKGVTTLNYPPLVVSADGQVVPALLPAAAITGSTLPATITGSSLTSFGNPAYGAEPQVNLLVNGGLEIWQRGSGPFTAQTAYSADRWFNSIASGDTLSVSKDTTHQDGASSACAAATYTKSTGGSLLIQKLEDYIQLQGKAVSLSFRVKTSTANATRVALDDGTTVSYSSYHSGSGNYETLTVTATMGASASEVLAMVEFDASCTAYLDNAMLVVGSAPINYIPLTPAEEWSRCQRYYELRGGVIANEFFCPLQCLNTSGGYGLLSFSKKAVTPTVTFTSASNFDVEEANGTLVACTAVAAANIGPQSCQVTFTVGSTVLAAGNASALLSGSSAGTIAIEANP